MKLWNVCPVLDDLHFVLKKIRYKVTSDCVILEAGHAVVSVRRIALWGVVILTGNCCWWHAAGTGPYLWEVRLIGRVYTTNEPTWCCYRYGSVSVFPWVSTGRISVGNATGLKIWTGNWPRFESVLNLPNSSTQETWPLLYRKRQSRLTISAVTHHTHFCQHK